MKIGARPGRIATQTEPRKGSRVVAPGTKQTNHQDRLDYVWIPPGMFQMGCSGDDNECQDHEKPSHPSVEPDLFERLVLVLRQQNEPAARLLARLILDLLKRLPDRTLHTRF